MTRGRFDKARLFVNAANLAASLAYIAGAAWALSTRPRLKYDSRAASIYDPALKAFDWYSSFGLIGKGVAALAGLTALASALLILLLSFKFQVEDTAVMLLGIPFYLTLACAIFLLVGFVASVAGQMF